MADGLTMSPRGHTLLISIDSREEHLVSPAMAERLRDPIAAASSRPAPG